MVYGILSDTSSKITTPDVILVFVVADQLGVIIGFTVAPILSAIFFADSTQSIKHH